MEMCPELLQKYNQKDLNIGLFFLAIKRQQLSDRNTHTLTYKQLAVQLQVYVSISRSLLCGSRELVKANRCLFNIAFSSNAMPPVIVQWEASLHANLQWTVAHIEGEEDLSRSYIREGR